MLKKISTTLLISFLLTTGTAQAYDLPKLKLEKKVDATIKQKKNPILKSDWKNAERFERNMRMRLLDGEELAPYDSARIATDKNYVFIAFYNDAPYFLDRYSIKIKKNSDGTQVWEQKIFPISKNFSPKNATATHQTFCLAEGKLFNSTKAKDALSDLTVEADKNFLTECFKVGYYFAFGNLAQGN